MLILILCLIWISSGGMAPKEGGLSKHPAFEEAIAKTAIALYLCEGGRLGTSITGTGSWVITSGFQNRYDLLHAHVLCLKGQDRNYFYGSMDHK